MTTNRKKLERIALLLAIASLLTTFSAASAQDERVLKLAYSTLTEQERALFQKTPEEQREDYLRSVRSLAAELFAPLGKETEIREYSPEERPYAGEKGTLTPEQVAALKTFVAPRLETPPRALTDDEKKSVAQTFDLSADDFRLRELAFESTLVDFLGNDATAPTSCELFGVKLSDNVYRANYDELQPKLAAVLENHSVSEILDSIQGRTLVEQTLLAGCLFERFADAMKDDEYARVLSDYVWKLCLAGWLDDRHVPPQEPEKLAASTIIEEIINKALEARPNSWEVAYVYASTIWNYLPKTFSPVDASNGTATRTPYWTDSIPEGARSAEDRDRVLVLRALANALPYAIDAATTGRAPSSYSKLEISTNGYFQLLYDALRLKSLHGRDADLNVKTDLAASPELTAAEDPRNARVGQIVKSDPARDYKLPASFDDAANDGERLAFAQVLRNAARDRETDKDKRALFLTSLAALVRLQYNVQNNLEKASQLRRELTQSSYPLSSEQRERVQQEIARLDAFLAEVPTLKENEAFTTANPATQGTPLEKVETFQPERRVLGKGLDFIPMLKRSIELDPALESIVLLAQELQLRGDYEQARELWKRAKTAESFAKAGGPSPIAGVDLTPRRSPEHAAIKDAFVDSAIKKLEGISAISFVGDSAKTSGMNVSFDVVSRNVRNLKTTFYQLDLAPFLAQTLEPQYFNNFDNSIENLVAQRIAAKFSPQSLIAVSTEIRSETREIPFDPDRPAASVRTEESIKLEKPGVYLVEVADADDPQRADYALAFVNRWSIAFQWGRYLFVNDLLTGEPYANGDVDLLKLEQIRGQSSAKTELVKTDENGAIDLSISGALRILAVVQDGAHDEYDRSASLFDSVNNPYVPADVLATLPNPKTPTLLVLATDKPIYAPGETVEFLAQIAPAPGVNVASSDVNCVRVVAKNIPDPMDAPRALLAEFDVKPDDDLSYSGSFKIPEDAEPGEYAFRQYVKLKDANSGRFSYLLQGAATVYVAKRGAVPTPTGKAPKNATTSADANLRSQTGPTVDAKFNKSIYTLRDGSVEVDLRSSKPDAVVAVYKYNPSFSGSAPKASKPEYVRLTDGRGKCRVPLETTDAPYFTLVVNVAGDNSAQASYYLVGVLRDEASRGASLEAPERLKAGEKTKLVVRLEPREGAGAGLFIGRASLAIYDVALDVAPVDDFASYFNVAAVSNRFMLRQTLPSKPMLDPFPAPVPSSKSFEKPTIYSDYLADDPSVPRATAPLLAARAARASRNREAPDPFVLEAVPGVPSRANSDSILKTTKISNGSDPIAFEFDAPKTPGTYRVVFRAFDPKKGVAAFVKRDLVVE